MIGQAKVIVGAEIDDRLRLAAVGDGGAGFGGGAQLGLVKFDRPRARLHPSGEAGRGLKRIASFAREEVTEAEIGGIIVHKKTAPNESAANGMGRIPPDFRLGCGLNCWLRDAS